MWPTGAVDGSYTASTEKWLNVRDDSTPRNCASSVESWCIAVL